MMDRLTISLLGPFQVTLNDELVTHFGSDTARALLAYLTMHPGIDHRRDALAGLLVDVDITVPHNPRTARRLCSRQTISRGDPMGSPPPGCCQGRFRLMV